MSGVDVLAVMDDVIKNVLIPNGGSYADQLADSRAAVAELIDAAQALPTVRGAQVIAFEGADYVLLAPEDHEALCTALARVTGGAA